VMHSFGLRHESSCMKKVCTVLGCEVTFWVGQVRSYETRLKMFCFETKMFGRGCCLCGLGLLYTLRRDNLEVRFSRVEVWLEL